MHQINKWITLTTLTLMAVLVMVAEASATTTYTNISDFSAFLSGAHASKYSGSLAGSFELTSLGFEAGDTIEFRQAGSTAPLFTNKKTGAESAIWSPTGSWKQVSNLGQTYFWDLSVSASKQYTGFTDLDPSGKPYSRIFELNHDWVLNGKTLTVGTLLIGFNDKGGGDSDFDDFILAAKPKPANTPIPAAVWLLGSGIAGLAGIRRFSTRKGKAG